MVQGLWLYRAQAMPLAQPYRSQTIRIGKVFHPLCWKTIEIMGSQNNQWLDKRLDLVETTDLRLLWSLTTEKFSESLCVLLFMFLNRRMGKLKCYYGKPLLSRPGSEGTRGRVADIAYQR